VGATTAKHSGLKGCRVTLALEITPLLSIPSGNASDEIWVVSRGTYDA
jgi:hypothetical protein